MIAVTMMWLVCYRSCFILQNVKLSYLIAKASAGYRGSIFESCFTTGGTADG